MQTTNCNKHFNKIHYYVYVKEAWDMVAKNYIEATTASNQAICGGYKQHVTKDETKVTCKKCLKAIEKEKVSE